MDNDHRKDNGSDHEGSYQEGSYEEGSYQDGSHQEGSYEEGSYQDGSHQEGSLYENSYHGDEGSYQEGDGGFKHQEGERSDNDEEKDDKAPGGFNSLTDKRYIEDSYNRQDLENSSDDDDDDTDAMEDGIFYICQALIADDDPEEDWEEIRIWLSMHSQDEAREEIEQTGGSCNALHVICKKIPPLDIVQSFVDVVPEILDTPESTNGWLPLHIACAHGASKEVVEFLVEEYPEGITAVDTKGRTPLHFAILSRRYELTEEMTALLVSEDNVTMKDESGKIPLHYACAYGMRREALSILTKLNEDCAEWTDSTGFTPFHYSLSNCVPNAVEHLISILPEIVNHPVLIDNYKQIPLQLLSNRAENISMENKTMIENAEECLNIYLSARPDSTSDFISVVQSLPSWLCDHAVVHPFVQEVLNQKMAQKFHTAFYFFDFLFLLTIMGGFIVCTMMTIAQFEYIEIGSDDGMGDDDGGVERRFLEEGDDGGDDDGGVEYVYVGSSTNRTIKGYAVWFLMGTTYFFLREIIQVISLISVGMFKTWLFDLKNYLDLMCIVASYGWSICFIIGAFYNPFRFRVAASVTLGFYGAWLLLFLKSALIGFAVFISGMMFVILRLAAFLVALFCILLSFALMFLFVYMETSSCEGEAAEEFPFCNFQSSLLTTVTMLIGDVDDTTFYGSHVAMWFYVAFFFLVVILLANVLIAIVTDSYGVIKNERSSNVFWANRLDFIAEIDVIVDGPWTKFLCNRVGLSDRMDEWFSDMWDEFMEHFNSGNTFSLKFTTFVFIVLVWMPLGIVSAGVLLPPQIREAIFFTKGTQFEETDPLEIEVNTLKDDIGELQNEFRLLASKQKKMVGEIRDEVGEMKDMLSGELGEVRVIMSQLFELYNATN